MIICLYTYIYIYIHIYIDIIEVLPKMTRDAQEACEAILSKVRGNPSMNPDAPTELSELYRRHISLSLHIDIHMYIHVCVCIYV